MTEEQWLTGNDPGPLLTFIGATASDRKLRLFATACCRRCWDVMGEGREMVAVAERFADGQATEDELEAAHPSPDVPAHVLGRLKLVLDCLVDADAINAASGTAAELAGWAEEREQQRVRALRLPDHGPAEIRAAGERVADAVRRQQAEVLRELVGNPFRRTAIDPAWLTPRVTSLATDVHEGAAYERLPLVADGLASAGCNDRNLLDHLHSPGPHVHGCWAVDLLLGIE